MQSAGTVLCGQCHTRGQCPSCQPVPHYTSGKGPLEVKVPEWRQRVNDREAPPAPPADAASKVIASLGPASFCWSSVVLSLLSLPESLATQASSSGPAWPDVSGVGNGYSVRVAFRTAAVCGHRDPALCQCLDTPVALGYGDRPPCCLLRVSGSEEPPVPGLLHPVATLGFGEMSNQAA